MHSLDITHWLPTIQRLGLLALKLYDSLLAAFSCPSPHQRMDCRLSKGLPHSHEFTFKGVHTAWHLCWSPRSRWGELHRCMCMACRARSFLLSMLHLTTPIMPNRAARAAYI